jgi:uncharacterized membrane protein
MGFRRQKISEEIFRGLLMYNFMILFLVFSLYSFFGWLCESVYCSLSSGKFINRGFLTGPFCPVYGAGGILVVSVLSPFHSRPVFLFFMAVLLTSLLEYLTGIVLEMLFHAKYWDYSGNRFNFQGRVCLKNSLLFGLMSVLTVLFLNPAAQRLLARIPGAALPFLTGALILYFTADTAVTVSETLQLSGKLDELQQVLDEIKEKARTAKVETLEVLQETIGGHLDEDTRARLKSLYEKKERLETGVRLLQRRIIRAFPTMRSIRNNESLQRIKEMLQSGAKYIRRR